MAKAAAAKGGTPKSRLSVNQSSTGAGPAVSGPQPPLPPTVVAPVTTGEVIPTPDCLATRKASIHVPSKLVSGGPWLNNNYHFLNTIKMNEWMMIELFDHHLIIQIPD